MTVTIGTTEFPWPSGQVLATIDARTAGFTGGSIVVQVLSDEGTFKALESNDGTPVQIDAAVATKIYSLDAGIQQGMRRGGTGRLAGTAVGTAKIAFASL